MGPRKRSSSTLARRSNRSVGVASGAGAVTLGAARNGSRRSVAAKTCQRRLLRCKAGCAQIARAKAHRGTEPAARGLPLAAVRPLPKHDGVAKPQSKGLALGREIFGPAG